MLVDEHRSMVEALVKPGSQILATLTPERTNMIHMAIGIAGEGGEMLDAIKKHAVYNKPLDRQNVVEELGDLEFYMEGLRQAIGITREETLTANIHKLVGGDKARYASGTYSDEAAQNRADKSPA